MNDRSTEATLATFGGGMVRDRSTESSLPSLGGRGKDRPTEAILARWGGMVRYRFTEGTLASLGGRRRDRIGPQRQFWPILKES